MSCYSLLYQSLLPNSEVTICVLKQYIEISSCTRAYILKGENARIRSQRVCNFLLVLLDSKGDYMQFCYLLNKITVLSDLQYRLIAGMQTDS